MILLLLLWYRIKKEGTKCKLSTIYAQMHYAFHALPSTYLHPCPSVCIRIYVSLLFPYFP